MEQRTRGLSVVPAMVVGVLGVGAALAVGDLVAAFTDPGASPFLAVGNSAIDLTPLPLKDFAVRTFGTYDKVVLLAGMGVFLLLAAVAAGLLSRKTPLPGTVLAVALGGLGVAAVLARPNLAPVGVVAPLAGLIAGVAVFRWLHWLGRGTEAQQVPGSSRRTFLLGSLGALAGIGLAGLGGRLLIGKVDVESSRTMVTRRLAKQTLPTTPGGVDFASDGTPTFLTPNSQFYRVDTALSVPQLRAEDWTLRLRCVFWRLTTSTERWWTRVSSQLAKPPRAGSNRPGSFHTDRKASCTASSANSGSTQTRRANE
jgi:hypothetical protein